MDNIFAIEFNGRFVKTFKRRANAEACFRRCVYRIDHDADIMRMIGLPSEHVYCSTI